MRNTDVITSRRVTTGLSRLKLFLALSRAPHLLLDLATPALAALLCLGAFPSIRVTILGLVTAFAGYTAIYGLNDLVDLRTDREKLRQGGFRQSENYLDAVLVRHPVAQGLLSFRDGFLWVIGWAFLAIVGAWLLNPICVLIFLAGGVFEMAYCRLWKIGSFRIVVSGAVKTCGAVAAVFAVDPNPPFSFSAILFCWLFFWEIGGQNIPNDWAEVEEDTRLQARTVLVQFGPQSASAVTLASVFIAVIMNLALFTHVEPRIPLHYVAASSVIGIYLLWIPAYGLFRTNKRSDALILFKWASYYPLALLTLLVMRMLL